MEKKLSMNLKTKCVFSLLSLIPLLFTNSENTNRSYSGMKSNYYNYAMYLQFPRSPL